MEWKQPTTKTTTSLSHSIRDYMKSLRFPFLFIMSFAIICTSVVIYHAQRQNLEESLFSQVKIRAHNVGNILQNNLNDRLSTLLNQCRDLVSHYKIRAELQQQLNDSEQSMSSESLRQNLNRHGEDSESTSISLLDNRGHLIFSRGRNANPIPSGKEVIAALEGEEFSGITQEASIWVLRAAVPIRNDTRISGVLILTVELNQALEEFASENQTRLILADENGIQARGDRTTANDVELSKIEQILNDKTMKSVVDNVKERLSHYMFIRIGEHDFVLVSEITTSSILQTLQEKKQEVLQLTLILLGILLPLSAGLVHILLRPLILLRKKAAGVAEKLAGISLDEYRGHEINRLTHTFDGMAAALEEQEDARQIAEALLQQEHATLESKIRERTNELEKTNDLLLHEISERTRTQQKAEDLQKFMVNLFNAMPSLLIGIDHNHRINQWNQEAQKFCGLSFEQVNGRPILEALPCLSSVQKKIIQTLDNNTQSKVSHFHWPSNDGERLVDITINPLFSNKSAGAVIRIDDVTERIRFDERMMQTEKMMSVGGLAAGMAHEINNPLASIIQSTQVISQRLSPDLKKNRNCAESLGTDIATLNSYLQERQVLTMLQSILDSGQRVGEIVNNMGSFSQENELLQSKQSFSELLNVSELLDLSVELATKDYDLKKKHNILQVKINRNYAKNLPKLLCTADQLKQVFFNLIQNAVQAMSDWDEMSAPPTIDLRVQVTGQMLSIEISDNGPGINPANQKRIFEPFYTTKDVGLGTGLGLSVSYFIITENHQGQLSVSSTSGQGTCFHILLPLQSTYIEESLSEVQTQSTPTEV